MSVEQVKRLFKMRFTFYNYLSKKYFAGNEPIAAPKRWVPHPKRYLAGLDSKHFPKGFLTTS